jgi:glycosyltransferase involved in cell wall biosynthesis
MRLLLVNRALPFHVAGGLERHFEDLACGLAAAGHEVHLLTAALPPGQAAEGERLKAQGLLLHQLADVDPQRYSLAWMRRIGPAIEQIVREVRPDVVHAQEFSAGAWPLRPRTVPFIMTVHGTITSETPLHRDVWPLLPLGARPAALLRYGRRFLFAGVWRRSLAAAESIVVDSQYTRNELLRDWPTLAARLHVVPLGVPWATDPLPDHESARAALGWRAEAGPYLLTLGRLEWAKGQDLALETLAGLRQYPWQYVIPGEGSWRPRLEKLIARHRLQGRVTLMGRVDGLHKQRLLAAADLFVWPERTHPAFGLVGVEAHLAGTPVLATRRGAIPEVLGELPDPQRWLADAPTAQDLRVKLEPLLRCPADLAAARAGLREHALRRFSFSRMVADTTAAYAGAD